MTRPMHVLLIAPSAPPKNSPEAMQVGRFLGALDPAVRVTLVTTPIVAGWQREDSSLKIDRPRMNVIAPALPFHRLTQRVLANRRLSFLHRPDSDFWLTWFTGFILRRLTDIPDVIYSRSAPFSAAMLARRVKWMTGRPWLMHLSDPWSESPYRKLSGRRITADRAQEASCFADADMITFTTQGQADHYRARYPARAKSISVTSNMMPAIHSPRTSTHPQGQLRLVYTGALYGDRNPATILTALRYLHDGATDEADQVRVDFYGNMPPEMAATISETPSCFVHGPIPFAAVSEVQAQADILVTIEPGGEHPLRLHFMPSKNLDYIATGNPILAITPRGSETDRLCRLGHGWAFDPNDAAALAKKLSQLLCDYRAGKAPDQCPRLHASPYLAHVVTADITEKLHGLAGCTP